MTTVTVRSITSRIDIIWRRNGAELERVEGVNVSFTTDNSVLYTDAYNILQLSTTDDGREYQCEVVINTSPLVKANDSIILNVTGKLVFHIMHYMFIMSTQFLNLLSHYLHLVQYKEL